MHDTDPSRSGSGPLIPIHLEVDLDHWYRSTAILLANGTIFSVRLFFFGSGKCLSSLSGKCLFHFAAASLSRLPRLLPLSALLFFGFRRYFFSWHYRFYLLCNLRCVNFVPLEEETQQNTVLHLMIYNLRFVVLVNAAFYFPLRSIVVILMLSTGIYQ